MKIIFLMCTIFIFASCDNPTRTRFEPMDNVDPSLMQGNPYPPQDSEEEDPPQTGGTDVSIPEDGFEDCILGYQYYGGPNIGSFGLCQNNMNETRFKIKMANQDLSVGTCFVPVHIVSGGNSYKLGIAECVHNRAGQEYNMILTKERSEPINGVMVIKAGAPLNAYMSCMSAKIDYMRSVPNCQYSQQCMYQADQYANQVCTQFVGTFSTFYKQVNL